MAVSLALIILSGLLVDYIFTKIKVPGLVGMLFVGIIFGPFVLNIIEPELMTISEDLRMTALVIILLRAGLAVKKDTLNRVGRTALVMSFLPALFEGIAVTMLAPIFFEIDYMEAAILGAVLAGASPAVIFPSMISFINRNMGSEKGIPTMILSASAVNIIFVVVIFTVLLGVSTGLGDNIAMQLLAIPESILLGIFFGSVAGFVLLYLFKSYKPRATKMTLMVISVSIVLTWLEDQLKGTMVMSSLLGVMTIGFILLEKGEIQAHKISDKLSKVWVFAEILLFVLVGAQVNIDVVLEAGFWGAILIIFALMARSIGTWLSLLGGGLDSKEKTFCVMSFIPKATVQAAIGAVPLEMGVPGGEIILALAVLSIILTAPTGAIAISLTGEKWLVRGKSLGAK
ncbi:MAG: cation:proton antiporter [Nitrospinales bacterium]